MSSSSGRRPPALLAGKALIGVDYGLKGDNLPSPSDVVELLINKQGVKNVKIYDVDPKVLDAFKAGKGNIKLSVAVPNEKVPAMADNRSGQQYSNVWVRENILKYKDMITSIAMGNEWLHESRYDPSKLVPAMEHLYASLQHHGLHEKIKVSTPHAFDVIAEGSFPPSKGKFKNTAVMKLLLGFLKKTHSFLMMNIYPFLTYAADPENISMDYALFKGNHVVSDIEGRRYTNLFDAMVDTVISAMTSLGHSDMEIVITETGWPNGGSNRPGVNSHNAHEYNQKVINHVLKKGTPRRPDHRFQTYIFALFNENEKEGGYQNEEKFWGHFYPNRKSIYELKMAGT